MNAVLAPRPAATLILVRDGAREIEVFMMQRTQAAQFAGGAFVFPGGALDAIDHSADLARYCEGVDDSSASKALGIDCGGLAYWIAAIRECFEESGLLLGHRARGMREMDQPALDELRRALAAGETSWSNACRDLDLRLATDQLVYFGHWITQAGRPRRYDTRFFVCPAPSGQTPLHDDCETIAHLWIAPSAALGRNRAGSFNMLFPTIKTLEQLARYASVDELMRAARSPSAMHAVRTNTLRAAIGSQGVKLLVRGDYAYAEVGKLNLINKDKAEGSASYEITPGRLVALSDRVSRLTAPNPGMMTGPGTNTYLIAAGDAMAVIDPGPLIDEHIDAIVNAARAKHASIRWIFCTHTHMDHSPAASRLHALTHAELLGMPAPRHGQQDESFVPHRLLRHGDRLPLGGASLRVIHTPGHASNQLCYLLEEERLLFTGDHIMQGSTVVINPPDGDMSAYFRSLRALLDEDIDYIAPGHGFLMDHVEEVVERLLVHRLARENKVVHALARLGEASIDELVPIVYDDTPSRLHLVAARSLLAHCLKLAEDDRVVERGGRWIPSKS